MPFKRTYIFVIGLILLSSFAIVQHNDATNPSKLVTTQTDYNVGKPIVLKFTASDDQKPLLYCSNSYGSTLVSAIAKDGTLQYIIPENITKKIGVVNWILLDKNKSASGQFNINPKAEVATMETYIGPPSIEAGATDYTMLVVIPTDSLDNPVPTNTKVDAKFQFLASEEKEVIFTKNLISYKNIYSKKESGRMLVSSESLGVNSKEFTINVWAAIPTDFKIMAQRPHNYADGNQVTTFNTTVIKDKQDNVVSDGTFVTFFITNTSGNILKTTGTTIKGVAHAKIIHPDFKDNWSIKAYVDGMAESDTITLSYQSVIEDFDVAFADKNRKVLVGPLQSFMEQMIPDGLHVKLLIYKDNMLIDTIIKTSFNGYVTFNLKPAVYQNDTYSFSVETAGINKTFNNKKLW
ncbi:hypothetical protein [Olleya sp. UBA1516]|uniref:hypothetical protein n=1 Tax=Olleya sp. UBA1516 TaxID=1947013 RepID=UPI0025F1702B|nr:hypothetical protein [Olleya sp. UBA1516]|tara:strand:- start:19729 stop:20946 length:1218 start_codon:yes stop_codon:yes gene_type:complete